MQGIAHCFHAGRGAGLITSVGLVVGCAQTVPVSSDSGADTVDNGRAPSPSTPSSTQTAALTLVGVPNTTVVAGGAYAFQPISSQSGSSVLFTIVSQPKWATFDTETGFLSGTPGITDVGTTVGIMILVSDATSTASIGPFDITVTAPADTPSPTPSGSATLTWVAPTLNLDGTRLTNLAGFHIHFGTSATDLSMEITVPGVSSTTYVINGLSAATYYFTVAAYTSNGTESPESNLASKSL